MGARLTLPFPLSRRAGWVIRRKAEVVAPARRPVSLTRPAAAIADGGEFSGWQHSIDASSGGLRATRCSSIAIENAARC